MHHLPLSHPCRYSQRCHPPPPLYVTSPAKISINLLISLPSPRKIDPLPFTTYPRHKSRLMGMMGRMCATFSHNFISVSHRYKHAKKPPNFFTLNLNQSCVGDAFNLLAFELLYRKVALFQMNHKFNTIKSLRSSTSRLELGRDIVRGVQCYIVTGSKQVEIGTKLSEDSRKYGVENSCTSGTKLSKAALGFSKVRAQIEAQCENLLKSLGTQVAEPLRAMVVGAPLEEARHLAQRYDIVGQEVEAQLSSKHRKLNSRSSNPTWLLTLNKVASAMAAVEGQQQRLTLQRFITLVEADRNYQSRVLQILDQLEAEV